MQRIVEASLVDVVCPVGSKISISLTSQLPSNSTTSVSFVMNCAVVLSRLKSMELLLGSVIENCLIIVVVVVVATID